MRVSIGDIADLLELSPREIEELRKFHNDPKPKEVRVARVEGGGVQQRSAASCRGGGAQRMDLCYFKTSVCHVWVGWSGTAAVQWAIPSAVNHARL